MYFTARRALGGRRLRGRVASLDFRDARTMGAAPCAADGRSAAAFDHMDFTASGRYALVSCEFSGRAIVVDMQSERVVRVIPRSPSGAIASGRQALARRSHVLRRRHGARRRLADPRAPRPARDPLRADGRRARHGPVPEPGREGTCTCQNRGEGSISVILVRDASPDREVVGCRADRRRTWGGVSANGRILWLSGRSDSAVYAILDADRGGCCTGSRSAMGLTAYACGPSPARYFDRPHRHPPLAAPRSGRGPRAAAPPDRG